MPFRARRRLEQPIGCIRLTYRSFLSQSPHPRGTPPQGNGNRVLVRAQIAVHDVIVIYMRVRRMRKLTLRTYSIYMPMRLWR